MRRITQGSSYVISYKLFLASDHLTPSVGNSGRVIYVSKNGSAFSIAAGTGANTGEIGNGWYFFEIGSADTDQIGELVFRVEASSCDPSEQIIQVVPIIGSGGMQLTDLVEPDWTVQEVLKMTLAALAGPTTFDATGVIFRNPAETKNRITSAVDEDGNRSDMTYDKT